MPKKNSTCPSGKLRTKITSPIAKSNSPGLSDTTFFARWLEKEPIEKGSYIGVNQAMLILYHWCYVKTKEVQVELAFFKRKKPYLTLEKEILIKILDKKIAFTFPHYPLSPPLSMKKTVAVNFLFHIISIFPLFHIY